MRAVTRTMAVMSNVADLKEKVDGILAEIVAIGGTAECASFFLDANGDPRTDLGYTEADFSNAVSALQAVQATLETHKTNIYQGIQG